jgi:hypothetical protein
MNLDALDRWIVNGPSRRDELLRATCTACGEESPVTASHELGAEWWQPEECPVCHEPWHDDTPWVDDEPDPDRMRE